MLDTQALQTAITLLIVFISAAIALSAGALVTWRVKERSAPLPSGRRVPDPDVRLHDANRDNHELVA